GASGRRGARHAIPSQRTATNRHSSFRFLGRSSGPFQKKCSRSVSTWAERRMAVRSRSGGARGGAFGEDGAYPLSDLAWAEGLGHVFVRAAKQAALAIDLLALGAQHDHVGLLEAGVLLDLLAHLVAVHVRHHDVEKHERRTQAAHALQPFGAVGGGFDGVPLALQQVAERAQNVRLVVNDEDWPRHVGGGRLLEHGVDQLLFSMDDFQAVSAASMAAPTTSGGTYRHLSIHSGG